MKILALEFSSPQRSVAVLDSETGSTAEAIDAPGVLTMKPFTLIESALQQAGMERGQIDTVAVGLGPGSYTGIRAAIALAQGWRIASGVKLCGISSAETIAAQELGNGLRDEFNVVIDAQRGEFYLAAYERTAHGGSKRISPIRIVMPETIKERENAGQRIVGPEVTKWFPKGRQAFPGAAILAKLASTNDSFVSGDTLEPIYLRETAFVKTTGYCLAKSQSSWAK